MKTLQEILKEKKYNTDKHTCHKYIQDFYEEEFKKYKEKESVSVLEIGVLHGESLKLWHDYFDNRENIVGIDVFIRTDFEEVEDDLKDYDIKIHKVDSFEGDGKDRKVFKQTYRSGFDIIIDDGLHKHWSQTKTFDNFFPILKDGGVYVIEDIDCRRDDVEIIKNHISSIDIRYCTSISTTDPESPEKSYQQPYGVIRK